MQTMPKTLSITLAALAVGLMFAPVMYAITITDATLSNGTVTVSGKKAARNVEIFGKDNRSRFRLKAGP